MVSSDAYWLQRLGENVWVDLRISPKDDRMTVPLATLANIPAVPQEYYYLRKTNDGYAKVLPMDLEELPWKTVN